MNSSVRIIASANAVPPLKICNDSLFAWHGKKDPTWFVERFGIRSRYSCFDYINGVSTGVTQEDLLVQASREALANAGCSIEDIDLIIVATDTPSHIAHPDDACQLHKSLGAKDTTFAFTTLSGCFATILGLMLAVQHLRASGARRAMVCSATTASSSTFRRPKETAWLPISIFGDAATCTIVEAASTIDGGFSSFYVEAKPHNDVIYRKFGGSKCPIDETNVNEHMGIVADFRFELVPTNLQRELTHSLNVLLTRENLALEDVDWVLFNMSNGVVQMKWLDFMGIDPEKTLFNIAEYGNCGSASFGMVLADFMRERKPKKGDRAALISVGTGLQYGGVIYTF